MGWKFYPPILSCGIKYFLCRLKHGKGGKEKSLPNLSTRNIFSPVHSEESGTKVMRATYPIRYATRGGVVSRALTVGFSHRHMRFIHRNCKHILSSDWLEDVYERFGQLVGIICCGGWQSRRERSLKNPIPTYLPCFRLHLAWAEQHTSRRLRTGRYRRQ